MAVMLTNKHVTVIGIFVTITISLIGWGFNWSYNTGMVVSELQTNQKSTQDKIDRIDKRITFLERTKMAASHDVEGKIDIGNFVRDSQQLSLEQFNDALEVVKKEEPKVAIKLLEEKSYFTKEQLPKIFSQSLQNSRGSKIK